jgi:hypothetical protein
MPPTSDWLGAVLTSFWRWPRPLVHYRLAPARRYLWHSGQRRSYKRRVGPSKLILRRDDTMMRADANVGLIRFVAA